MCNINLKALKTTILFTLATMITGLAIIPKPTWAQSSPNVSWGWIYLDMSKSNCLERARLAFSVEFRGRQRRTSDYVSVRSDDTQAFIQCFGRDNNRSLTVIVVSSLRNPRGLRDLLYDAMERGVIEGNIFPGTIAENSFSSSAFSSENLGTYVSSDESDVWDFIISGQDNIEEDDSGINDNKNGTADALSSDQDNPEEDNTSVNDNENGTADTLSSDQDDPEEDNTDTNITE